MKNKNRFAFMVVVSFASLMLLISCGKSNPATSEKDVPDSALTDSVPASGEDEYQQDLAPQGRTGQLDSTKDSVNRKP